MSNADRVGTTPEETFHSLEPFKRGADTQKPARRCATRCRTDSLQECAWLLAAPPLNCHKLQSGGGSVDLAAATRRYGTVVSDFVVALQTRLCAGSLGCLTLLRFDLRWTAMNATSHATHSSAAKGSRDYATTTSLRASPRTRNATSDRLGWLLGSAALHGEVTRSAAPHTALVYECFGV